MENSKPIPKPLLLILVLLWIVCFSIALNAAFSRIGYPPFIVKASEKKGDFPTVINFIQPSLEKKTVIRVGDKLIRFGKVELRGTGPVDFITHVANETKDKNEVKIVFSSSGQQLNEIIVVDSYATYMPRLPGSVLFIITALILAVRAKPSRMVRMFVWTHFCIAFLLTATFAGSWPVTYLSIAVHVISITLAAPLAMQSLLLFPHNIAPTFRGARILPWLFAVIGPFDASRIYLFPFSEKIGTLGLHITSLLFIISIVYIITKTYRRSYPIEKRKLKWYLLGLYCALALPTLAGFAAIIFPGLTQLAVISAASLAFIPITHIISIMRFNFFDIDRIISNTASYTLLSVVLLAAIVTAVPTLADELSRPTGIGSSTLKILFSIVLAVVIISLNKRLNPLIDKLFFTERKALEKGIGNLLSSVETCSNPSILTEKIGEQLNSLLQPDNCAIYAREAKVFSPVFTRGRAIPPAFKIDSPLVKSLEERFAVLPTEILSKKRHDALLTPFDKAALETLGVPIVLPIRRSNDLVAFVCLGPKRSGDVYTSTDMVLLKAVMDRVSTQLLNISQRELIRQGKEMQKALRRYVPEMIADHIEGGHDLEIGEKEVTVLFVDIRGYSSFAEIRKTADVFSTVNQYTRKVSQIVRSNGGNVIEFNGDGMMAVFGVPQKLEHKERSAVDAARQIIPAVDVLKFGEESNQIASLSVGVGIATGEAFVGNVQASDRLFWTAIGTTTNMAARFQEMTRQFEASIIIDSATWKQLGEAGKPFEPKENTPIRGLLQTADLYVLPSKQEPLV